MKKGNNKGNPVGKYASVYRKGKEKFIVKFDAIKTPIEMNSTFLAHLLNKKQIIVKNLFNKNELLVS